MSRGKYTPEFKAKIVLEVLQGERELGAIAAENNLNPNMVRNWKAEFVENASSIFVEHGKASAAGNAHGSAGLLAYHAPGPGQP